MKSFLDLKSSIKQKKRIVVVNALDLSIIKACYQAYKQGDADFILTGKKNDIENLAKQENIDISGFEIVDTNECVKSSIDLINSSKADILMKGNIKTSDLMKAVLNKENGLNTGNILSHVLLLFLKKYFKPLLITDTGLNVFPDLKMKVSIINNAVNVALKLNIFNPKVAILSAVEVVNEKMPVNLDAAILSKMNERGQIKNCIVDGPLALDNAISKRSVLAKKINTPIEGEADILVVPDVISGNIMAKAILYFADYQAGGVIVGAKVPIILLSRSDTKENKYNSILFAIYLSEK